MQTLNFTHKLSRQRRFLSFLLPLFALFMGLNAQAQGTLSNSNVFIDNSPGAVNTTYGGSSGIAPQFNNQNLGSFDINTPGSLLLNGGEFTVTQTGAAAPSNPRITYQLFDVATGFDIGPLQTIQLLPTGSNGSTFTYQEANALRDLVIALPGSGNYGVDVTFAVTFGRATTSEAVKTAYFEVTGTKAPAPTISANTITFDPNGVPPVTVANPNPANPLETYNINPPTSPLFQGADLSASATGGAYDVNTGQLLLNGTSVTVTQSGPNNITSVVLYYRTRPVNGGGGAFQPINLTQTGGSTATTKTFVLDPTQGGNSLSQPNLIATSAVTQAGTYVLEVYYQANGFNSATNSSITITDPPVANTYYTATFTVSGTPIAQTIWTGGFNDNWFDVRNWSNGVPNDGVNALVRDLGTGNSIPYPNVNSDSRKVTAAGAVLYDNTNSGPAKARNLILGGTSQASRSICRLEQGQLQVFGDFSNLQDSFIQRENTILEFAGGNQNISNGSFFRVDISGGGTKALNGIMNVSNSLNFLTGESTGDQPAAINRYTANSTNAGILTTNISTPGATVVILSDRGLSNDNNGAQITGETDFSYLYGFVRTSRVGVSVGETRTYGNMGLTLTFGSATNLNNPGIVEVTRNTVESYSPVSNKFGIRRIFGVRPSDQATTTGGLVASMVFRYRDAETRNLNGPNTITPGTASIPEANLTIFLSSNAGGAFSLIGRDGPVDQVNNTVTRSGVTNFATFTLGDQNNPLPVRLTAFNAQRMGTNALITWQTASEENSKGYDVQVSTNGVEYRTLASVPSVSSNTNKITNYRYEDAEANKTGLRYYRLRQVDLDEKEAYFQPVSVNFDGKVTGAEMAAYPNPLNGTDNLHLAMQTTVAGKGQVRITDMTGRTLRQEALDLNAGSTDLSMNSFGSLQAGTYMVRVTLPSGETKNLKVVKQ